MAEHLGRRDTGLPALGHLERRGKEGFVSGKGTPRPVVRDEADARSQPKIRKRIQRGEFLEGHHVGEREGVCPNREVLGSNRPECNIQVERLRQEKCTECRGHDGGSHPKMVADQEPASPITAAVEMGGDAL